MSEDGLEKPINPVKPQELLPYSQTPGFQHGISEYGIFTQYPDRMFDSQTGEPHYKGLSVCSGTETILPSGAKTPEEYATNVRIFLSEIKPLLKARGKLPYIRFTHYVRMIDDPSYITSSKQIDANDISEIEAQMTGFGKAAFDAGDVRTALLAFEAAGAFEKPQMDWAISKLLFAMRSKSTDLYLKTLHEIQSRIRHERPRSKFSVKKPEVVNPDVYRRIHKLVSMASVSDVRQTSGMSNVYYVGPEESATRVVKLPLSNLGQFDNQVECFKRAQEAGLSIYPIVTAILDKPGSSNYTGIEMERIFGRHLQEKPGIKGMTPEKFGLDNRLRLIYDLIDLYRTTDLTHEDLFNENEYLREKKQGKFKLTMNWDNMILEDGTNRLRLIDPLANPQESSIFGMKAELEGIIDFLFSGKGEDETLPTNSYFQQIGQKITGNLQRVRHIEKLPNIIPPEVRLPGEKH